jgi:hypothetical protein
MYMCANKYDAAVEHTHLRLSFSRVDPHSLPPTSDSKGNHLRFAFIGSCPWRVRFADDRRIFAKKHSFFIILFVLLYKTSASLCRAWVPWRPYLIHCWSGPCRGFRIRVTDFTRSALEISALMETSVFCCLCAFIWFEFNCRRAPIAAHLAHLSFVEAVLDFWMNGREALMKLITVMIGSLASSQFISFANWLKAINFILLFKNAWCERIAKYRVYANFKSCILIF